MPRSLPCICMALSLLGCSAEPTSSAPNDESLLGQADGAGLVDVASSRPADDVPRPSVIDGETTPVDTTRDPLKDAEESAADVTQEAFSYGEDMVVGEGACTNDSDLEAVHAFDPVGDFMAVGMDCIDPRGGQGGSTDDETVACLVAKLGAEHGFSEECATCVTAHVLCTQANCMGACMSFMMTGEISDECTACIAESDCKYDFTDCSGLDPDAMQP